MTLKDLNQEDRESLMAEMRVIIEQENINKNASAMYAIKKKELIKAKVDAICKAFNFNGPDKSRLKDRYITMTNYLYTLNINPKHHYISNGAKITDAEQWDIFRNICEQVSDCIINCIKYKE